MDQIEHKKDKNNTPFDQNGCPFTSILLLISNTAIGRRLYILYVLRIQTEKNFNLKLIPDSIVCF